MKRKLALLAVAAVAVTGMVASSAFAQSDGKDRPGWGKGDNNHIHTGPPGRSTHPGHHHNWFWWWLWNFFHHFFLQFWWK